MKNQFKLPKGYKLHDGKGCPVEPDELVDCIIRTGDGLGHSGAMRARLHDWAQAAKKGRGHIVAWRKAQRGEEIDLEERWPES